MDEEQYEPTNEEKDEIEKMLNNEYEQENNEGCDCDKDDKLLGKLKGRRLYTFYTDSHFTGWLKVNGIIW